MLHNSRSFSWPPPPCALHQPCTSSFSCYWQLSSFVFFTFLQNLVFHWNKIFWCHHYQYHCPPTLSSISDILILNLTTSSSLTDNVHFWCRYQHDQRTTPVSAECPILGSSLATNLVSNLFQSWARLGPSVLSLTAIGTEEVWFLGTVSPWG